MIINSLSRILIVVFLSATLFAQEECTVAVISGAATVDGRPLLWKNRDSNERNNNLMFFRGPKYDFIGVINAGDTTQVWMGLNTAGFAIMNAESMDQEGDSADTEGYFMKQALGVCGSLDDFQGLLEVTNAEPGRGTRANFGCIDALGGCAFFETGNHTFTRFDATDTSLTKHGFLVRANFSMTGQGQEAYGNWRYHRARRLLTDYASSKQLSSQVMSQWIVRDLVNDEVNPYPLPYKGTDDQGREGFINTHHSINRHRTVSCAVFHGVKRGENPALATMWVMLGQPQCSIALPFWPRSGSLPEAVTGQKPCELNRQFQRIREKLYPDKKRPQSLDTRKLFTGKPSWIEKRQAIEGMVFSQTDEILSKWRRKIPEYAQMARFQDNLCRQVLKELRGTDMPPIMKKY